MPIKLGEKGMVSTLPGKLVLNKGKAGNAKGENEGTEKDKDMRERGSRHKRDWQKLCWFFCSPHSRDRWGVVKTKTKKKKKKKKRKI